MYLYKTKQRKILQLPWMIINQSISYKNVIKEYVYAFLSKTTKHKAFLDKYLKYKYKNY